MMFKISWDHIKNSDYYEDTYYCGNTFFSKKANMSRLVSLLDLPGSVVLGCYNIGARNLPIIKNIIIQISLLLMSPVAIPSFNFLLNKKIEPKIFNYKIHLKQLRSWNETMIIPKIIGRIIANFVILGFFVPIDLIITVTHVFSNTIGMIIPECGRQQRLIRKKLPIMIEEFLEITKTNSLKKDIFVTFGLSDQATKEEVKRHYRQFLLSNHPDKHPTATQEEKEELTKKTEKICQLYQAYEKQNLLERFKNKSKLQIIKQLYLDHLCDDGLKIANENQNQVLNRNSRFYICN